MKRRESWNCVDGGLKKTKKKQKQKKIKEKEEEEIQGKKGEN